MAGKTSANAWTMDTHSQFERWLKQWKLLERYPVDTFQRQGIPSVYEFSVRMAPSDRDGLVRVLGPECTESDVTVLGNALKWYGGWADRLRKVPRIAALLEGIA